MYKYKIATLTLGRLDWNNWKPILFTLKNKVVFITGSSRGIGREIAIAFLKIKDEVL